ncbi:hypothetical protein PHYPSEUDO_000892 [Phytophthora pseudosyringae]|uniref:RxLR effector protein n=1 Tax=Phytophthora pseudosyringae TaxID=221518 RepID=A0A8T1W151_9STRA|nr:hypothetical protein PHYPSEUDO_000892 [Phytophthora pseudosyringae]
MRLSYVFVVVAAAFLATSEALADTNVASISKVASPSGPSQRRLRSHHTTAADEEERLAPADKVAALARSYNIDLSRAAKDAGYLASLGSKLQQYQTELDALHKLYRKAKASRITDH